MKPLCIIPARGGSMRVPRKNMRHICGHPLVWYAMQHARSAGLSDRMFVVTDDDEIEGYCKLQDVEVYREPPVEKENTIRAFHYGWNAAIALGWKSDLFIGLEPTSPLLDYGFIWKLVEVCTKTGGPVQVVTRTSPLAFHCCLGPDGEATPLEPLDLSQNLPPLYLLHGVFASYPWIFDHNYDDMRRFYQGFQLYGALHDGPMVDIDQEEDFAWTEYLLRSGRYPHLYSGDVS